MRDSPPPHDAAATPGTDAVGKLRAQRDALLRVLDQSTTLILTLDPHLRVLTANPRARDHIGAVAGQSFAQLVSPAAASTVLAGLNALREGRTAQFEHEAELPRADGAQRLMLWSHTAMDAGDDGAVLSLGVDLAERRGQAAHLLDRDGLTGLPTAQAFRARVNEALAGGAHGAVVCVNLARLRYINEFAGYAAGDRLLRDVAHIARAALPEEGFAARVGADEFAVFLPGADAGRADSCAGQIVARVAELAVVSAGGVHRPGVYAGYALAPQHGQGGNELLASAAAALSEARADGPGQWLGYDPRTGTREHLRDSIAALEVLRAALAEDRLVFHFQPQVRVSDGVVIGHEALARVVTPDGEVLAPARFIHAALRYGEIARVDEWALVRTVRTLAQTPVQVSPVLSFNLSGAGLRDARLTARVEDLLAAYDVAPSRLVIEVTETEAVRNLDAARQVMTRLRQLGVRFALDDFGAGHSSLNYLRELPADIVKIDGSFVTGLAGQPEHAMMVRAIHQVACGLGKQTIAQFVDSADTLAVLAEIGVDCAQGYYTGSPAPEMRTRRAPEVIPEVIVVSAPGADPLAESA